MTQDNTAAAAVRDKTEPVLFISILSNFRKLKSRGIVSII